MPRRLRMFKLGVPIAGAVFRLCRRGGRPPPARGKPGARGVGGELALACNNRGVVRRAEGKLSIAISDSDSAIQILRRLHEQPPSPLEQTNRAPRSSAGTPRADRVVAIAYSEATVDLLSRPAVCAEDHETVTAIALATSLKNRGCARRALGIPSDAHLHV
ncbi:MAG: hypothetical protein KGS61_12615 [Verrucomicrobia bacterium]|nr:hypothetical protein [Verrucomicrobiota bacterium]